jgi:hypothetical protein
MAYSTAPPVNQRRSPDVVWLKAEDLRCPPVRRMRSWAPCESPGRRKRSLATYPRAPVRQ